MFDFNDFNEKPRNRRSAAPLLYIAVFVALLLALEAFWRIAPP